MRTLPLLLLLALAAPVSATIDPLAPASSGGIAVIDRELRALATNTRILVIGAHPDDEDTTLLAWFARGVGGEAAYLSLSRGEGGQNRYGTELGEGLGLLRSRELEAARRLDGARQYFTRAYDWGFSKTLEEALGFWPEQELVRDAVRVVRRFRPQVIVSIFPASPLAGHGQHQAAGLVAERVFAAAADPEAFPELIEEGLVPWQAEALYRRAWRDPENATHRVTLDRLEPLSGRSFAQIAMASRSLHRSQDMGQLEELGERPSALAFVAGQPAPAGGDPFVGIDTRPVRLTQALAEGPVREEVGARLETVEVLATEALAALRPDHPAASLPFLNEIVGHLDAALASLRSSTDPANPDHETAWLLGELESRSARASRAAAAAAGLAWDATTSSETVVPGNSLELNLRVWNGGSERITLPELAVTVWSPSRWAEIQGVGFAAEPREVTLSPGQMLERSVTVRLRPEAAVSAPSFLLDPRLGFLYDWSRVPESERGLPFSRPGLEARLTAHVGGARLRLTREVVARWRDQELGEVRRPLRVVPAIEVEVEPSVMVRRLGDPAPARLSAVLTNRSTSVRRGAVEALLADGPVSEGFELAPGERRAFTLLVPSAQRTGRVEIPVRAQELGGTSFDLATPLIDYPHIAPIPWPRRAHSSIETLEVVLPNRHIGWVRGPGEDVPERLAALGARGRVLDAEALVGGDLSGFDVIVIGSRAWETEPALARANTRLLEWTAAGGTLITLYQRYPFFDGPARAPDTLALTRPMPRVVDETAPLRPLDASHPLWHRPNRFGEADQLGWVQERGLFFPSSWGESFRPFVAIADPGEQELVSAILAMRHGRGVWAYTGLAFFRQLPEGVPGAWRLFANLLALSADDVPVDDVALEPPPLGEPPNETVSEVVR